MQPKKLISILVLAGILSYNAPAQASGIPTVDVAAIAQELMAYTADIQHYGEVISSWQQQYKQMTKQYDQLKASYEAITGSRNLGQLLYNPQLYNALPPEWQAVYDNVQDAGESLQGILAKNDGQKFTFGTINTNVDQIEQGYKAATERLAILQGLMMQIDGAVDQKAAQDLANRIGIEQALLQNENTRIGLMVQMQQVQMKVAEEQEYAEFEKVDLLKNIK